MLLGNNYLATTPPIQVRSFAQGFFNKFFNVKWAICGADGVWREEIRKLRTVTRYVVVACLAVMSAFKAVCATTDVAPENGVGAAACRLIRTTEIAFWTLPPLHIGEILC